CVVPLDLCSSMLSLPRGSPPFPYTTLFRSTAVGFDERVAFLLCPREDRIVALDEVLFGLDVPRRTIERQAVPADGDDAFVADERSEEHTSELQSRENLVCRLLLEKKKSSE